jgi:hypothetical protein
MTVKGILSTFAPEIGTAGIRQLTKTDENNFISNIFKLTIQTQ